MGRVLRDWNHIISTQVIPMLSEPGINKVIIAQRLGLPYTQVKSALQYRGIKVPNVPHHGGGGRGKEPAVPMEVALTPEQCQQMRRFLGRLVQLANDNQGRKVDVGRFIKEYRKRVEL